MKPTSIGIVTGIIFGIIDVLLIFPMTLPNKELVLIGAFSNRFAIGFLTATAQFGLPYWLQGIIVGLLISVLPAVNQVAFAPMILGMGAVGGLISSVVTKKISGKRKK